MADPVAELAALRQQVAQLTAYVAQQQQQQQQVKSSPPVAAVVVSSDKPRLLAPPAYDGRSAGGVDLWLRELRKQFAWYGATMQGDAERIRFAAAHLTAVALDWWESLESNAPTTWLLFEEQIKTRFHPANSADAARAALDNLRQPPKQLVHEYTAEFRRLLLAVPKMEEGDRVFRYLKGLQPRLAGLVRLQAPKTLADAISLAARVDGLAATDSTAVAVAPGGSADAAADGPVPMDVNNAESIPHMSAMQNMVSLMQTMMQTQARQHESLNALSQEVARSRKPYRREGDTNAGSHADRVPNISTEEIENRRRRGACFFCGKEGHRKVNCPNR